MRRIAAVLLGATFLVGLAIPAGAATEDEKSAVLNVYWTSRESTGQYTFRQTTWYVGAYVSSEYPTSSDGYQSVDNCVFLDRRHYRCRQESFKVGYSDLKGPGEYFTIDPNNLDYATLRGLYPLQSYDQNGNPTGPIEWTVITADVTGVGPLDSSRDTYTHHEGDCRYRTTTDNLERGFVADGTVNGVALEPTKEGFMSYSESHTISRGCGPY